MPMPRAGLLALCLLLTFLSATSVRRAVAAFPDSPREGAAQNSVEATPAISAPPEGIQSETNASVQVLRFALYDAGIYPREARVEQGVVVISLVDYTGGSEGLIIEREVNGGREHAGLAKRSGKHWRGRQELKLKHGTYCVYDASRPENRATLIVGQ